MLLLRRRGFRWLDEANTDVRFAVRSFAATPGITAVALLTIAVGIGASAALFSAMDAVLLQRPAYPTADRLVAIWERRPTGERNAISTRSYRAYTDQPSLFERSAATVGPFGGVTLTSGDSPVQLRAIRVGASYFDIFGARALLGRTFGPGDDLPGHDHVIVLSHSLWVSQFGSDATLVGRSIQLDGEPYTVVGVMPPDTPFDRSWIQLWMPLAFGPDRLNRTDHWIFGFTGGAVALLKPGVTVDSARAQLDVVASRLARTHPDSNEGWGVELEPYRTAVVGKDLHRSLYLLLGAVGCLLLLACVNVAHILTTRGVAREKELAIRVALGAGRGRLVRQLLTESVALSVAGGVPGVALAYGALPPFIAALPRYALPAEASVMVDARVLVVALALSIIAGTTSGVLPALKASRRRLSEPAAMHTRGGPSRDARRLQGVLSVSEVALALVLVIAAGLLIRSFLNMRRDDGGIRSSHLLAGYLPVRDSRLSDPERLVLYFRQIVDAVQSIPGIDQVALADGLPFEGVMRNAFFQIVGRAAVDRTRRPLASIKGVGDAYFSTLGLRVRRGRPLNATDRAGSPYVVVINSTMARRFFPDEDPVGQRLLMQQTRPGTNVEIPWEIVGVIDDERIMPFSDKSNYPAAYVPLEQSPTSVVGLVVRTDLEVASAQAAIRSAVTAVNKDQPLTDFRTVEHFKADSMVSDGLRMALVALFAAVATFLAAIGLVGMASFAVQQRAHEMGIRAALGAQPSDLVGLVVGHGLALTAVGLLVGLLGAFGVAQLLSSFLFGVEPIDPMTIGISLGILGSVAALACYVPARRLATLDPLLTLRRG